jgi:hypothetical protein
LHIDFSLLLASAAPIAGTAVFFVTVKAFELQARKKQPSSPEQGTKAALRLRGTTQLAELYTKVPPLSRDNAAPRSV